MFVVSLDIYTYVYIYIKLNIFNLNCKLSWYLKVSLLLTFFISPLSPPIQLAKMICSVVFLKLVPSWAIGILNRKYSTVNRQVTHIAEYNPCVIKIPCILQLSNKENTLYIQKNRIFFSNFTMIWKTLFLTYKLGILLLLNLSKKKSLSRSN